MSNKDHLPHCYNNDFFCSYAALIMTIVAVKCLQCEREDRWEQSPIKTKNNTKTTKTEKKTNQKPKQPRFVQPILLIKGETRLWNRIVSEALICARPACNRCYNKHFKASKLEVNRRLPKKRLPKKKTAPPFWRKNYSTVTLWRVLIAFKFVGFGLSCSVCFLSFQSTSGSAMGDMSSYGCGCMKCLRMCIYKPMVNEQATVSLLSILEVLWLHSSLL